MGACCHFFTGEKALDLISTVKEKLTALLQAEDISKNKYPAQLTASLLSAFCNYKKITGFLDCDELIEKTANLFIADYTNFLHGENNDTNKEIVFLSLSQAVLDYYEVTKDNSLLILLKATFNRLCNLDFYSYTGSCHHYLSFCSCMLKYAQIVNESAISEHIATLFDNFLATSQSINYESALLFNDKNGTDAGATAISLEVALALFNNLNDSRYLTLARRIWFNGMQFCQRFEGHVGANTFTYDKVRLRVKNYSGDLVTTCRYAVGLKYYALNKDLFADGGELTKDRRGRYFIGDKMFGFDESEFFGRDLLEIPTLTAFDKQTAMQLVFKLVF